MITEFERLAQDYPPLKKYLRKCPKGVIIDFEDRKAVRALTYAILWVNFQLKLQIPLDCLCPMVRNRLFYIEWIKNHLKKDALVGVDIGTGSSCIYPLLGCRVMQNSRFIGLEIARDSVEIANENVKMNELESRIKIVHSTGSELLPRSCFDFGHVDFVMTNPPFYQDEADISNSAALKNSFKINPGKPHELITHGGQVEFVNRLIDESLQIGKIISIYSCLVGKKQDMLQIVARLAKLELAHKIVDFKFGKTKRWIVAWSLLEIV